MDTSTTTHGAGLNGGAPPMTRKQLRAARAAERAAIPPAAPPTPRAASATATATRKKTRAKRGTSAKALARAAAALAGNGTTQQPATSARGPTPALAAGGDPLAAMLGEKLAEARRGWTPLKARTVLKMIETGLPGICGFAPELLKAA